MRATSPCSTSTPSWIADTDPATDGALYSNAKASGWARPNAMWRSHPRRRSSTGSFVSARVACSRKRIIANHPLGFSRSGIPTHLQPWHGDWAASGNGFEVDLVPDYKILHDAGYNVLAYDLRNHGMSSAANGGVTTHGFTEGRDVVGSLEYVRTRPDTRDMIIGLFSRCMGGVSTFAAMTRFPEAFDGVRCPLSP